MRLVVVPSQKFVVSVAYSVRPDHVTLAFDDNLSLHLDLIRPQSIKDRLDSDNFDIRAPTPAPGIHRSVLRATASFIMQFGPPSIRFAPQEGLDDGRLVSSGMSLMANQISRWVSYEVLSFHFPA